MMANLEPGETCSNTSSNVVTKWYGGEHLGVVRVEIMRIELVVQVARQIEN
jgi:hypothetical protein